MDNTGTWRLSPAYDLTFAVDTSAPAYVNRHSLFVNRKDDKITIADLLEVAARNDIRNPKELIERVRAVIADFPSIARENEIPDEIIQVLRKEIGNIY